MDKKSLLYISLIAVFFIQSCIENKTNEVELITIEQMNEAIEDETIQLIDVRTTEEYFESHLSNAQNICVSDIGFKEKAKTLDKNKPVYVYCKKGKESKRAAKILKEMGFKKIYNFDGGIFLWEENGYETDHSKP